MTKTIAMVYSPVAVKSFKIACLSKESFKKYSKTVSRSNELYILSAVRTPVGLFKGVLNKFTAPQLMSFAFKEALQRAIVPFGDIHNIFLGYSSHTNCNEVLNRTGLSKSVKISSVSACAVRNFINGTRFLLESNLTICMTGGMVSMSNCIESNEGTGGRLNNFLLKQKVPVEFIKSDYENFINAHKNGAFYDEITKIIFRKKGHEIVVTEDELNVKNINFNKVESGFKCSLMTADGSAAFVIATEDYVQQNHLTPIAKIISFAEESVKCDDFPSAQVIAIEKALNAGKCQSSSVSRWEIDYAISDMYSILINHFGMNSLAVNRDGGVLSLGYPVGLLGAKALCHLVHSLSAGELGCATSCDFGGTASAVIIKKLQDKPSGTPHATLYTKKLCPLCDELKGQLKPFERRFLLQEIDIEAEENKKYHELFKYEIPVLFLAGRFLCKHKLDAQHFNRRLLEFEDFH